MKVLALGNMCTRLIFVNTQLRINHRYTWRMRDEGREQEYDCSQGNE